MKTLVTTLLLLSAVASASADTLFVAAIAEPGGDGQSWNTAYRTLENALSTWASGDEIWVARGEYTAPSSGFTIRSGMKIYGGFVGYELVREQRDYVRYGSTVIENGAPFLFAMSACDSTTRIDGMGFRGVQGTAVVVQGGAPQIYNCTFVDCVGASGSAINAIGVGRMRVEYCLFRNNRSLNSGGAVAITDYMPDAKNFGPFFGQCYFIGNRTQGDGGAIWWNGGVGIAQIASCAFADNFAKMSAGAVRNDGAWVYVTNTTFSGNISPSARSMHTTGGMLQNSIMWNGIEDTVRHMVYEKASPSDTARFTSTANLIERDPDLGFWTEDPGFTDPVNLTGPDGWFFTDDDGLRPQSWSVAINAGVIDKFVNHRQTDMIGNPRLVGRKVDLGAFEAQRAGRMHPRDIIAEARQGKLVFMFRHAKTDWDQNDPGPSPECFPGRNLIHEGREQSRMIGKVQRYFEVPVGDAFSSTACRCWETLDLMVGYYEKKSYWAGGGNDNTQRWIDLNTIPTNGCRVISTHDAVANALYNPSGDGGILTSAEVMEGDCMVVRPMGDTNEVIGQFCSDTWDKLRIRFPDLVTGVNEEPSASGSNAQVRVYPNPADASIMITGQGACTIRDLHGRTVWSGTVTGNATVNTTTWSAGQYVLTTGKNVVLVQVLH